MGAFGIQERNTEGQMLVDFKMAASPSRRSRNTGDA